MQPALYGSKQTPRFGVTTQAGDGGRSIGFELETFLPVCVQQQFKSPLFLDGKIASGGGGYQGCDSVGDGLFGFLDDRVHSRSVHATGKDQQRNEQPENTDDDQTDGVTTVEGVVRGCCQHQIGWCIHRKVRDDLDRDGIQRRRAATLLEDQHITQVEDADIRPDELDITGDAPVIELFITREPDQKR